MKVTELKSLIDGKILNTVPVDLDRDVKGVFCADLMSDVLASIKPEAVLVTGLCNPQVIRTAQMADVSLVVLVRGKNPPHETIKLANEEGIPLISSPLGMYELSGRLYTANLPSLEGKMVDGNCECS